MLTYNPTTNKFIHAIQIPQNGIDSVDSITTNPAFQAVADDINYIAYSLRSYRPHIRLKYFSDVEISVDPFGPISVSSSQVNPLWWQVGLPTTTVIDVTNLEGGGSFAINTAYYIYLTVSVIGVVTTPNIVISSAAPESTLTFKSIAGVGQFTHRYLGSFSTDSVSNIRPFTMVDFRYLFPERELTTLTVDTGTPNVSANLTAPSPIVSSQLKSMLVKLNVTCSGTVTADLKLSPRGISALTTFTVDNPTASSLDYFSLEVGLGNSNQFTSALSLTAGTGAVVTKVLMVGYNE